MKLLFSRIHRGVNAPIHILLVLVVLFSAGCQAAPPLEATLTAEALGGMPAPNALADEVSS